MREEDLYAPVKRWLESLGYEVKAEIGACDILALKTGASPVVIELKQKFNLRLIYQAIERQKLVDFVYVAVAQASGHEKHMRQLCHMLGLGLLLVQGNWVEPLLDPEKFSPRKQPQKLGLLLKEFAARKGDPNQAGTTRRKRITAYRQDALKLLDCLKSKSPEKLTNLRKLTEIERAGTILQNNVYGWFVKQERGVYALSDTGKAALITYAETIKILTQKS